MAKSGENFIILRTLTDKKINPIAYRLWLLMGSYRTKMNFNFESLAGAQTALEKLFELFLNLDETDGKINDDYKTKFDDFIADDLNTPQALALLWELSKDTEVSAADKKSTLLYFDKVLGLGLDKLKKEIIPEEVMKLAEEREEARKNKDFAKSDELRAKINSMGYEVKDTSTGSAISKIKFFLAACCERTGVR